MQIFKIDKALQTGNQNSEASGDGIKGVSVQLFSPWGSAYRPKAGSISYAFPVGGDLSNSAHITPQPTIKIELAEGESAFGNFEAGSYMIFKNDGSIVLKGKVLHEGDTEQKGNLKVSGSIEANTVSGSSDVLGGGKSLKSHTHPQNDGNHYGGGVSTGAPN